MRADLTSTTLLRLTTTLFVFIQLAFALVCGAGDFQVLRTEMKDGFYFGVTCNARSGLVTNNTPIDGELIFGVWTTNTNDFSVYVPYEPEYAYECELYDSNGAALPKTPYAKRFGTRYFDLDTSFSNKGAKLRREYPLHEQDLPGQYLFLRKPDVGNGYIIYTPNDLFIIKNPGKYTLEIRFQIIVRTGRGRDMAAHIVRFPPLEYPIVKADTGLIKQ
jgi:hypothetical protein